MCTSPTRWVERVRCRGERGQITPPLTHGEVVLPGDRLALWDEPPVPEVHVSTSLTETAAAAASRLHDLRSARDATPLSLQIRERHGRVDSFLAESSRHVITLQAILVGAARRELGDGRSRELARACHQLQLALRAMHARRWGSSQLMGVPWRDLRRAVDETMELLLAAEESVSAQLQALLKPDEVERICDRLAEAEMRAPTRPHPYLPHRGIGGRLAHRAAARSDAFWDGVQGRVIGANGGSPS